MSMGFWRKANYYARKKGSKGYCDDIIEFFKFENLDYHIIIIEKMETIRSKLHEYISEIEDEQQIEGVCFQVDDSLQIILDQDLVNSLRRFDLSVSTNFLIATLIGAIFGSRINDNAIRVQLEHFQKSCAILGCWSSPIPITFMENPIEYPLRCNLLNRQRTTIRRTFQLSALTRRQSHNK